MSMSSPENFLQHEIGAKPQEIRVFRIEGDSMKGSLHPGQNVVVNVSKTDPSPPGVFVLFDGFGMVAKRVEVIIGSNPSVARVSTTNPAYQNYERPIDELNIVGRVVGRWERM